MLQRLGFPFPKADAAVLGIVGTTQGRTVGPPGADVAVDSRTWGEFPRWPTSAAGSWLLIESGGGEALFA
jgi:hypothetical protein